jgi:Predicted solute binding protein
VKYPFFLSGFNENWIFSTDFWKILKYKVRPVKWVVPYWWRERHTINSLFAILWTRLKTTGPKSEKWQSYSIPQAVQLHHLAVWRAYVDSTSMFALCGWKLVNQKSNWRTHMLFQHRHDTFIFVYFSVHSQNLSLCQPRNVMLVNISWKSFNIETRVTFDRNFVGVVQQKSCTVFAKTFREYVSLCIFNLKTPAPVTTTTTTTTIITTTTTTTTAYSNTHSSSVGVVTWNGRNHVRPTVRYCQLLALQVLVSNKYFYRAKLEYAPLPEYYTSYNVCRHVHGLRHLQQICNSSFSAPNALLKEEFLLSAGL